MDQNTVKEYATTYAYVLKIYHRIPEKKGNNLLPRELNLWELNL